MIPVDAVADRQARLLDFSRALNYLGEHAAMMDREEHLDHEDCLPCETMILLARVVNFGEQLRKERRAAPTG